MKPRKKSTKLPSFIKVKIPWKDDEMGRPSFNEDECFQNFSEAMSKLIEEHTEMDDESEIDYDPDFDGWA